LVHLTKNYHFCLPAFWELGDDSCVLWCKYVWSCWVWKWKVVACAELEFEQVFHILCD
jgi:hypothetical protein